MELGRMNALTVFSDTPQGLYLVDEEGNQVLLPNRYSPSDARMGEVFDVFVYLDSEDRVVATTQEPYAFVGDFCCLEVIEVNRIGAFLDWGLEKDLLLPFRNQTGRIDLGDRVVVYVDLDKASDRIVATQKLRPHLNRNLEEVEEGDTVDAMVYEVTETMVRAVTTEGFDGRLHRVKAKNLYVGDEFSAKVRAVYDGEYLELSTGASTLDAMKVDGDLMLQKLRENGGFLALSDHSDPREIQKVFGWSKKYFKKVSGYLFKHQRIDISDRGIHLTD